MNVPGRPLIYVITRGLATSDKKTWSGVFEAVEMAVDAGVGLVQIREKQLSSRELFELARTAAEIRAGSSTKLLINDRADIALAAGANGVHLTSTSISAAVMRGRSPKGFMIGVSTHTADEVRQAKEGGADLAVYGPVFESPGKGTGHGLGKLSEVCDAVSPFPVIGLGGVDGTNCSAVIAAGASGVAGIRSFNDPAGLRSIIAELKR